MSINKSYQNTIKTLDHLVNVNQNNIDTNKVIMFLDWISAKTHYFEKENQPFCVSDVNLPKTISQSTYNYLRPELKRIVDTGYNKNDQTYERNLYCINVVDATKLYKALFLSKRHIVWVDFGFNLGKEFGGKHPAVILKNLGEVLIVAPISTNANEIQSSDLVITFEESDLYNMPAQRKRFTNITRIAAISLLRVDTTSKVGSLKTSKFNEILTKIKNYYSI